MVSGGFDPLHNGHVRMIMQCAKMGDVIVALNTDEWLERKKGKAFMPFAQRREIMMGLKGVTRVVEANALHGDDVDSAVHALNMWLPDVFANGGDRLPGNTPEVEFCLKNNIALMFNVGGSKIASSSDIVKTHAM